MFLLVFGYEIFKTCKNTARSYSVSVQASIYCLIKGGMPNEAISVLLTVLEKGWTSDLLSCKSIINELFKGREGEWCS